MLKTQNKSRLKRSQLPKILSTFDFQLLTNVMLPQLFNSNTRAQILGLFLSKENPRHFIQEIVRLTDLDVASVHRELKNLEEIGLFKSETEGKQKYFTLDLSNPFVKPLRQVVLTWQNSNLQKLDFIGFAKDGFPLIMQPAMQPSLNNSFLKANGIQSTLNTTLIHQKPDGSDLYFNQLDLENIANEFQTKIISNPKWFINLANEAKDNAQKLTKEFQALIKNQNLETATETQISVLVEKFAYILGQIDQYGWLQTGIEFNQNKFNRELFKILEKLKTEFKHNLQSVFSLLTTPLENTLAHNETLAVLELYKQITNDSKALQYFQSKENRFINRYLWQDFPEIQNAINRLSLDYGWLGFGRVGPIWENTHYIKTLQEFAISKLDANELQLNFNKHIQKILETQNEYSLVLDQKSRQIFEAYRESILAKIYRKEYTSILFWQLQDLLGEIAKRKNMTLQEIRNFYPLEIAELLQNITISRDQNQNWDQHLAIFTSKGVDFIDAKTTSEYLQTHQIQNQSPNAPKVVFGHTVVAGRIRGKIYREIDSKTQRLEDFSIVITTTLTKNLEKNQSKILGLVIPRTKNPDPKLSIWARSHGIPCIDGVDEMELIEKAQMIDLDATHSKATEII